MPHNNSYVSSSSTLQSYASVNGDTNNTLSGKKFGDIFTLTTMSQHGYSSNSYCNGNNCIVGCSCASGWEYTTQTSSSGYITVTTKPKFAYRNNSESLGTVSCRQQAAPKQYFEFNKCQHDHNTQYTVSYEYNVNGQADIQIDSTCEMEQKVEFELNENKTSGSFSVRIDNSAPPCYLSFNSHENLGSAIIACGGDTSGSETCEKGCHSWCSSQHENACDWGNSWECFVLNDCYKKCGSDDCLYHVTN